MSNRRRPLSVEKAERFCVQPLKKELPGSIEEEQGMVRVPEDFATTKKEELGRNPGS